MATDPFLGKARIDASGTVGTIAALALAYNGSRSVLEMQNVSANTLYFTNDGSTPAAGAAGTYQLLTGQGYNPAVAPTGAITVLGSASGTNYTLKYS